MRRLVLAVVLACAMASGWAGTSSAGTSSAGTSSVTLASRVSSTSGVYPSGCKRVAYTADGGYFSQGQFYWEPGDDVTVVTRWCYAANAVTSYAVRFTTTIPSSREPRLSLSDGLSHDRTVLDVEVQGDYESGVLNNVGFIDLVGQVTALGRHKFFDMSGAGG